MLKKNTFAPLFLKESRMTRDQAVKMDKSFYVDNEDGDWIVFGDNSGFAYASFSNKQEAQEEAKEMNQKGNKKIQKEAPTAKEKAMRMDKSFIVFKENDQWYVFGGNSGFAYSSFSNKAEALEAANEMNINISKK